MTRFRGKPVLCQEIRPADWCGIDMWTMARGTPPRLWSPWADQAISGGSPVGGTRGQGAPGPGDGDEDVMSQESGRRTGSSRHAAIAAGYVEFAHAGKGGLPRLRVGDVYILLAGALALTRP